MQSKAQTVADYLKEIPMERLPAMKRLRSTIRKHLPEGFMEAMSYGMIGYVVPHRIYPKGYHCTPELPLPFMSIASQKNGIVLYHMGLYASADLMKWFLNEYKKVSDKKPDIGKSCIRFQKPELIPFELIGTLAQQLPVADWIALYEKTFIQSKSRRTSAK